MIFFEGIFRRPRLKSNILLARYAHLFSGDIINVSGSNDSDKNCTLRSYYSSDFDTGRRYKKYFCNASSYTVSNYPGDLTNINLPAEGVISLDLEQDLPTDLISKYDVVFNHTVLEHVFDIFTAFKNLCLISKDVVILVVPQAQKLHDYSRGYSDFWRMTPFSVERLFELNGFTVLFRESTCGFSESIYLFYIASKKPYHWRKYFPALLPLDQYINYKNDGSLLTLFSYAQLLFDRILRRFFHLFSS